MRSFRAFRDARGWPRDAPIRTDHAREWLAELADRGALSSNSLALYKSALHTQAELEQAAGDSSPNPLDHPSIRRLLKGVANDKAEREQARRAATSPTLPLTLDIVLRLQPLHDAAKPRDCMLFAALALGVVACLRPSEMLGSHLHPARALRAEQLSFFSDAAGLLTLLPWRDTASTPSHCTLALEVGKTDQQRRGTVMAVGAPVAVEALWRWCRLSGARGAAPLFKVGAKPLTTNALVGHLRRRLARIGLGEGHFTGKSMRKGGASTLSALGVSADDIARAGWAPSSNTWQAHYANHPDVQRARALAVSRHMQAALVRGP